MLTGCGRNFRVARIRHRTILRRASEAGQTKTNSIRFLIYRRQAYSKTGAFAHRTLHTNAAAMLLDDPMGYGEAQTCAYVSALGGVKRLKDLVQVLLGDSRTVVFNENFYIARII